MNQTVTNPILTPAATSNAVVVRSIEIFNLLAAERGATFITFVAQTEPKMRKTGNPYVGNVVKTAKVNGQLNFNYVKAVEKALVNEGKSKEDFKQGESWHTPVLRDDNTMTPFCQHKKTGAYYLRFRMIGKIESTYQTKDGQPINDADLEPFIVKSDYANQGLDEPIIFLTYGLESIRQLTMNGQTYIVQ